MCFKDGGNAVGYRAATWLISESWPDGNGLGSRGRSDALSLSDCAADSADSGWWPCFMVEVGAWPVTTSYQLMGSSAKVLVVKPSGLDRLRRANTALNPSPKICSHWIMSARVSGVIVPAQISQCGP